jgi:hypothetical protein
MVSYKDENDIRSVTIYSSDCSNKSDIHLFISANNYRLWRLQDFGEPFVGITIRKADKITLSSPKIKYLGKSASDTLLDQKWNWNSHLSSNLYWTVNICKRNGKQISACRPRSKGSSGRPQKSRHEPVRGKKAQNLTLWWWWWWW